MSDFVTQRECEERRKEIEQKGEVRYSEFIQTKVTTAITSDFSVLVRYKKVKL